MEFINMPPSAQSEEYYAFSGSTIWQMLELSDQDELTAVAEFCVDKIRNKARIHQYINQCVALSGSSAQKSRTDKAFKHCIRELGADGRVSVITELMSSLSDKDFAQIKQWIKQSS